MESILIGKIANIHGIKGEVKIYPYTDDIDHLSNIKKIYMDEDLTKEYKVERCRVHKEMLVTKLSGIDDANTAELFKTKYVYIKSSDLQKLDEDTYYVKDLLGISVIDNLNDTVLGKIIYVFNSGANDVYEIEREDKTKIYLPAIHQVIKKVDIQNKKMYVEVMDGLI